MKTNDSQREDIYVIRYKINVLVRSKLPEMYELHMMYLHWELAEAACSSGGTCASPPWRPCHVNFTNYIRAEPASKYSLAHILSTRACIYIPWFQYFTGWFIRSICIKLETPLIVLFFTLNDCHADSSKVHCLFNSSLSWQYTNTCGWFYSRLFSGERERGVYTNVSMIRMVIWFNKHY